MGQQGAQLLVAVLKFQNHRCRESTQNRWHGLLLDARQGNGTAATRDHKKLVLGTRAVLIGVEHQWFAALHTDQADAHRYHKWIARLLPARAAAMLHQGDGVGLLSGVVSPAATQARRTGLGIPALESVQMLRQR